MARPEAASAKALRSPGLRTTRPRLRPRPMRARYAKPPTALSRLNRTWFGIAVSNLQLDWTEPEILADPAIAEPLVVRGVVCHGGYDADGTYVSPRTRFRRAAIDAWQQHHR